MVPLLVILLAITPQEASETCNPPLTHLELSTSSPNLAQSIQSLYHKMREKTFYCGAATALGALSIMARVGWGLSLITPWSTTIANECLLISHLCSSAAQRFYAQIFQDSSVQRSHYSWYLNQKQLSQIPTFTEEDKQLLDFLKTRWLAKATGFYPSMVDLICPCFGVSIQVHPQTTSSYARDPSINLSQTYLSRVQDFKRQLPHPEYFPLILTRPFSIVEYLPNHLMVPITEDMQITIEQLAAQLQNAPKVILDLTHHFPVGSLDCKKWFQAWKNYQTQLSKACTENKIDLNRIICIQRVEQEHMGGIRLLPLTDVSPYEIDAQDRFLLEWISKFGLTANRIELDRGIILNVENSAPTAAACPSREEFLSFLHVSDQNWVAKHPQKTLMFKGTLHVLHGLLDSVSEEKWVEIMHSQTRANIVQLSFVKIKDEIDLLIQETDDVHFFDTACRLEQVHANLCTLLEILSPFTYADFSEIYRSLLTSIPAALRPMTTYGIHASGMTSFAGVFKAVEKMQGRPIRILLGENTYFECITTANRISKAVSIEDATEQDWADVDLILAQFNPVLKRIDYDVTEYHVEKVADVLRKAFNARNQRPLTLALDCTLDYINSPRVSKLLEDFHQEIEDGQLNIAFYRSGLKYDLFGMDNYSGAPFYMIHNADAKWACFDPIISDPALQSDRLSLNWFSAAFKYAAAELELYRKQTFENTRALLNRVPQRLFNSASEFRIIPVAEDADPAFLDIKISGPLHQIRGAGLAGGTLYLKCMEGGHPIFYRPSIGFYHPNFTMLFGKDCTTIRLTLGLDPSQIDVLTQCFEAIDTLNGAPAQDLFDRLHKNHTSSHTTLSKLSVRQFQEQNETAFLK